MSNSDLHDKKTRKADAGVIKYFTKKKEQDEDKEATDDGDVQEPRIKDTIDVPPESAPRKASPGNAVRLLGGSPIDVTAEHSHKKHHHHRHGHARDHDAGHQRHDHHQHQDHQSHGSHRHGGQGHGHSHKKSTDTDEGHGHEHETRETDGGGASETFTEESEPSVLFNLEREPGKPSPHHHRHHHHRPKPNLAEWEGKKVVTVPPALGGNENGNETDELEPTASLLVINPSTGRPYPPMQKTASEKVKSKVTMFLPGIRSFPQIYEKDILEPAMAPVLPSLMVKRKKHKPQVIDELKVLAYAEHLFIRSTYEMMPFFYGVPNRYEVIDSLGQRIYFAKEMSGFWTRRSGSHWKNFVVSIVDFKNKEVCSIEGEPGFCQGAAQALIYQGDELWGRVCQELNCCTPRYDVFDGDEKLLYTVRGPRGAACYGTYFLRKNVDFPLFLADARTQIGKFSTQWTGPVRDIYTTANNFGVTFEKNLDIKLKTILLGAAFLLYFQYFEQGGGQPNSRTLYQHGRGYNRLGRIPVVLRFLLPLLTIAAIVVIIYVFETLP